MQLIEWNFFRYPAQNKGCLFRVAIISAGLIFASFIILICHRTDTFQSFSIRNIVSPVQNYFVAKRDYFEDDFAIAAMFDNYSEKDLSLLKKLKSIRLSCGEICDTTIRGQPGKVIKY